MTLNISISQIENYNHYVLSSFAKHVLKQAGQNKRHFSLYSMLYTLHIQILSNILLKSFLVMTAILETTLS